MRSLVRSSRVCQCVALTMMMMRIAVGAPIGLYGGVLIQLDKGSLMKETNSTGPEMHLDTKSLRFERPSGKPGNLSWNKDAATSQKGQDEWVFGVLSKQHGYFVDLAANDPWKFSNTYALEQVYRWTGLCIDGNEDFILRYKEQRSCKPVHAAVDCKAGKEVVFNKHGGLGGIVGDDLFNSEPGKNSVVLKSRTLEDILVEANAPRKIDYLSLDVEGSEWRVLMNFPFYKYTFRAMTIERSPPWLNDLLISKGYVWVKNYRADSYFVHSSSYKDGMRKVKRSDLKYCEPVPPSSGSWTRKPDLKSECR